jgi:threonine dehydratase
LHPDLSLVQQARQLLSERLSPTRLIQAPFLAAQTGKQVSLKLETELPTSSFKVRGALYTLAVNLNRRAISEVVASSTGNHGAAVAYAAKALGVKARIFLPANPNPVKRNRIATLGAEIVERGKDISDAFESALEYASSSGAFFLNDATDSDLPAATAVIGLEILEQRPTADAVLVPMGDTALIRGVGAAVKALSPQTRIIGVQAEKAPAYCLSWKKGEVVKTDSCDTIADGLSTRAPDPANVAAIRELVDDIITVSDEQMLRAIKTLLLEEHILAEPAGAASIAALLRKPNLPANDVVLVVSGANISPNVLRQAVEAG